MEPIIHPFCFEIDEMVKLLLVNFEKDPDRIYIGFEPQVFDDAVNGQGHLLIGWRKDGKVDVYHQESLSLDPAKYTIAGKGLSRMVPTIFKRSNFIINDQGVRACYIFDDLEGRIIHIEIAENHPKPRRPFDLLAPMGQAADSPTALPLIYLFDFYFVRRNHSVFLLTIDGVKHTPDKLPFPLDGVFMLFTRYSPQPFACFFNPNYSGNLKPIPTQDGAREIKDGSHQIFLNRSGSGSAIEKLVHTGSEIPLQISFQPPFPSLNSLPSDARCQGKFQIVSKKSIGEVGGMYEVAADGDQITIFLVPSDGWTPKPDRWMLRFLYAVAKPFKNWPKTYRWQACIQRREGAYYMESKWRRIVGGS
ncbi:hypothetical protein ADIS_0964 [Lunatimonas lonarensis]|uniref:Uncharacterized protein n=1 Tax=Lunatimonas lonarensis TaxID=1232681 RepID=R7ZXB1_9BACT|nr:hypothetical protein [Lunatimonas lonarensis]EON78614.1 hypothetical protein ADIS_0964 [Lunatimonas lonarensis]